MASKLEALWSPIPNRFILWGGDTITSYQLKPNKEGTPMPGAYRVSNTHVAELICSANNQHQVKCIDIFPRSEGDEIVAIGSSSGRVTVTYMAKLSWEGSGLPKKEFTSRCPRPCTSISFNPAESHFVAVGLEKFKTDNSIMIFDITQVCTKRDLSSSFTASATFSESTKPLWEFGMSEHCQNLSWFYGNTKILATGINMKFIRLFDLRDQAKVVGSTVTKAALGVCTNPKDDKYLASYFDNQVFVWDTRNIEKPISILQQTKQVVKVGWCPPKSNQLTVLQRDTTSVSVYDIQHPSIGNEEVEPTVLERTVNLKSSYPLTSFSWHRNDENRILCVGGSNAPGKIGIQDFQICDRSILNNTSYHEILEFQRSRALKNQQMQKFYPESDEYTVKYQRRAKALYGLEDDLHKNAEIVKDDEVLRNAWHFLHLSSKLVEEGKIFSPTLNTSYKYPGVLSILQNEIENISSEIKILSWADLGHTYCKGSIKYYVRSDRKMALQLCSWPFLNDADSIATLIDNLEESRAYTRAAAIAVFNLKISMAIDILNRAPIQDGLSYVGMALAGFSNEEDSSWRKFCTTILKEKMKVTDPYLKAMFNFLLASNNNYDCILKETGIAVDDRVGFALIYLPDEKLSEYLNNLSMELCDRGNLDGILLTGNSPMGLKLLLNYMDVSDDVQSTALIALRAFTHELNQPTLKDLILEYQKLLNEWKYWMERAEFDLVCVQLRKEKPPPQVYLSCTYCGKNISQHLRTLKNQQFSRINVAGSSNKLTGCPHCRKPLPRCIICLMTMGTPIGDIEGIKPQDFDNWFTWCQTCRHGGHSRHIEVWFKEHQECPMGGCSCKCSSLDYITAAN